MSTESQKDKILRILTLIRASDETRTEPIAQLHRIELVRELLANQDAHIRAFKTSEQELRDIEVRSAIQAGHTYVELLISGSPFRETLLENIRWCLIVAGAEAEEVSHFPRSHSDQGIALEFRDKANEITNAAMHA